WTSCGVHKADTFTCGAEFTSAATRHQTLSWLAPNIPCTTPRPVRLPLASREVRCKACQIATEGKSHAPAHLLPALRSGSVGQRRGLQIHRCPRQNGVHQPAARRPAGRAHRVAPHQYDPILVSRARLYATRRFVTRFPLSSLATGRSSG